MAGTRPLHVHIVIDGLGFGGAETLLSDLVLGGREAGLEFTVTALNERDRNPGADRLRAVGIEPEFLGLGGLLRPADHRRLWARVRELRPDVLHAHLEYSDLLAGVAARRLGLPCVSTIHVMRWPGSRRERLKLDLQARARRLGMQAVLCVSDAAREAYLAQRWPSPAVVQTVHNGVAADVRPGASAALRSSLGIAPGQPAVGTLSVLREGKGHDALFAAAPGLRRRFPDLEILMAGDGPDGEALRAAAAAAGVRSIGHVGDPLAYVGALDVLVHPSDFDAFPTALIEAAATGTPAVATRVGGVPEILLDGETGLLIPAPADGEELAAAIGVLLEDASRRAAMGAAARLRYDDLFSAVAWAHRMRAVYDAALAEGPRRFRRSQPG